MEFSIEQVKAKVKDIIVKDLELNLNPNEISDDISLYDDGLGLDSIAIINFVVLIEQRFDIKFNENEISSKLFMNINSLSSFIQQKCQSGVTAFPSQAQ